MNQPTHQDTTAYSAGDYRPPEPPPPAHSIFIGRDGLRAGWSLLIFLALMAVGLYGSLSLVHAFRAHHHRPAFDTRSLSASDMLIGEFIPFLLTVFVTWIMAKIEDRPASVYGLGGKHKLAHFLAGLAWGVTCLSLLIFALWKTGLLVFNGRLLFGSNILRDGALWLLVFLVVALLEEYLTRGYLLYTLARGLDSIYQWLFHTRYSKALGFWTAAILLSLIFGFGHTQNPGESPIGLLSAGLVSLVFCFSLWRTGSLWWAIGLHTSWDWAQSFLYGVADSGTVINSRLIATHPVGKPLLSGGTTGPEGSILILFVLVLITAIIFFTLPRAKAPADHATPLQTLEI